MTIIFLLLNLLMLTSSYVTAHRYFGESSFSEKLVSTFLIYISQITVTTLFLGVVIRNLDLLPIILLNCAISILFLLLFKKQIPKLFTPVDSIPSLIKTRDYFLYIFIFLFSLQGILLLIKIYFLPPDVWDVFAYHLHPVVEWFQQNFIPSSIDTPVLRLNRNPMGTKLLHFWIVKFFGDLTWVELPQFFYGLMVTLSSYALMLKMSIKKNTALRYAILIYFIPLILIESRTCQDHLALMGTILISTLYFVNVFFEKKYSQIVFLGLSLGLTLGTKISGVHIIVVFFLTLLLTKGFNRSQVFFFLKNNILRVALGIIAVFILGGYWYVKDKAILGSYINTLARISAMKLVIILVSFCTTVVLLFFVIKILRRINIFKNKKVIITVIVLISIIALFGIIKNVGLVKTFVLGYESPTPLLSDRDFYIQYPFLKAIKSDFIKNVLVFPFRIKDVGMYIAYTPDFLEQSGFGVQFFGFGLIAFAVMLFLIFRKKYRDSIMGFVFVFSVTLLLTYFIYYYSGANYRLFMFFPVFGLMLWAYLIEKWNIKTVGLIFIDVLILVMILFNMSVTLFEGNMDTKRWKTVLTIDNPLDRTTIKYSPFFKGADWKFIDKYIQSEEPIGYLAHFDSWISPYFDNQMKRRIFHLPSLPGFSWSNIDSRRNRLEFNTDFKESLRQRKIHFIHINPQGIRHSTEDSKSIIIEDKEIFRVADNLYYYKW